MDEHFAVYLARSYLAKGYEPVVVEEAEALVHACDIVLTKADGLSFNMLCIVDAEADPEKRFALGMPELEVIGKACAHYTGRVSGHKIPIGITILTVGQAPIDSARQQELKEYRKPRGVHVVLAAYVSLASRQVRMNMPFNGFFAGRRFIERLLNSPRRSEQEFAEHMGETSFGEDARPLLTWGILAVMLAVFVAEQLFSVTPGKSLSPSIPTLFSLGGLEKQTVLGQGEYFRLFTAPFLHGGFIHLALNLFCLWLAGSLLEALVGRWWLLAIFFVSALGGSLMSLGINGEGIISVGASGAVMGMLGAAFLFTYRLPPGSGRTPVQLQLLQILIPSLIPISRPGQHIDFAAHGGGLIAGCLLAWWLMKEWRKDMPQPGRRHFAVGIGVAGLLAAASGAAMVAGRFSGQ